MPSPVDINVILHERDVFQAYRTLRRENESLAKTSERAAEGVSKYVNGFMRSALPAALTVGTITSAISAGADRYEAYMQRGRVGSERAERYREIQERRWRGGNERAASMGFLHDVRETWDKGWDNIAYHVNNIFERDAQRRRVLEELDRTKDRQERTSTISGSMLERIAAASGRLIEAGMIRAETERIVRSREILNQYQGGQITGQQKDTLLNLSDRMARVEKLGALIDVTEGIGGGASEANIRQALGPADAYRQVNSASGNLDSVSESLASLGPDMQALTKALGEVVQVMTLQTKPDRPESTTYRYTDFAPAGF